MTTIANNCFNLEQMFKQLGTVVSGDFNSSENSHSLDFNNKLGKGNIKGIQLSNNITYLEYDIILNEDLEFTNHADNKSIHFLYSLKGDFGYAVNKSGKKRVIKEFQNCISILKKNRNITIFFSKNNHYKVSLISVGKENNLNFSKDMVNNNMIDFFSNEIKDKNFFHVSSVNLKILQKIEELKDIDDNSKGLTKTLMYRGVIETMIGLQVQHYTQEMFHKLDKLGDLTNHEIKTVKLLSESLRDRLHEKLTISVLTAETGLSPAKLQKIFKLMHDQTVNDYITTQRLNLAEKLIRETDLNISEVTYNVGLSSRSYFSKIFKQRYNCTPKFYQNNYLKQQNVELSQSGD